ncbi:MAG: insulinase family protein [Bacteroidales bacterium]|nr:insulinase family protein [Bacteroidales bacterium]MBN2821290.1 insulinase family protein [Bacteroidales bacterium]
MLRNLFLLLTFLLSALVNQAQSVDLYSKIPVDSNIIIGKLENGFTYYIRHNEKPENRFEIRLAVNAGSVLEDDDQQGLAHFVEHMCFNGTKHFEKNELVKYLESMGIQFGPEINAYTSFDETVYMLSVPSDSAVLVDKAFLIMEDWAHNVSFDSLEIEKERGVILEEWRRGQGPNQRIRDKYFPILFNGSKYAGRLPIGKKEIIENCKHESITRFYKDWYRPDLMALVIVGDIDPEVAEKKIKEHFSSLTEPADPRQRNNYSVPDHEGTVVAVATDKEAPYTVLRLLYKNDTLPAQTGADYLNSLNYSFLTGILNRRIAELAEQPDPPFVGAGYYYGSLGSRDKDALYSYAIVGESGIQRGISVLVEESKRVLEYGITAGEFERYKLDILKRYEQLFQERDKLESANLADEYVRNYLTGEPIPGIAFEYRLVKENIDNFNLEDINKLARKTFKNTNNVVVITGPENERIIYPDENEVLSIISNTLDKEINPYSDDISDKQLITNMPVAGKILTQEKIDDIDAYKFSLSNGATVFVKPTNFKNDEILFSAFAWGGTSVYPDSDYYSALHADGMIEECGLADFSGSELTKLLAGKTAYIAARISTETQEMSGNCRAEDLETMLQLAYLRFTSPRIDTNSFNSYINKSKSLYKNMSGEPMNYFYDKYNRIKANNHPRGNYLPLEEDWNKIDFQRVEDIYKDRFSNASEFTFVFVGSIQPDSLKPLLEKYIAALPFNENKIGYTDLGIRPPSDKTIAKVYKGSDPKSQVMLNFHKEAEYNLKDDFLLKEFGEILNRKYYEILREEMSGVYTVGSSAGMQRIPYEKATMSIMIPCSPENVDSLVAVAFREIIKIRNNGVSDDEINKSKEIYKREKEKNLEKNAYWLAAIKNAARFDMDFSRIASFEFMNLIKSEEIQRVANEYIDLDNYIQVVLYPEFLEEVSTKE